MEFALIDNIRSKPTPNATGVCEGCGHEMIAKCGEQLIWHWAHKGKRVCDPWWENEGPWHRTWKNYFPLEWHEVWGFDTDGEAHIADVKLPNGFVIELQHSAMPPEEMRKREAFYGDMVWVVDIEPFKKNFTVFNPLPDPSNGFVDDLVFVQPHREWLKHRKQSLENFDHLMFFRKSAHAPAMDLQLIHSGRELTKYFPEAYTGHHLFLWVRPREVWFQTTKPTYLDLRDGRLARLIKYGNTSHTHFCIKIIPKDFFILDILKRGQESRD